MDNCKIVYLISLPHKKNNEPALAIRQARKVECLVFSYILKEDQKNWSSFNCFTYSATSAQVVTSPV